MKRKSLVLKIEFSLDDVAVFSNFHRKFCLKALKQQLRLIPKPIQVLVLSKSSFHSMSFKARSLMSLYCIFCIFCELLHTCQDWHSASRRVFTLMMIFQLEEKTVSLVYVRASSWFFHDYYCGCEHFWYLLKYREVQLVDSIHHLLTLRLLFYGLRLAFRRFIWSFRSCINAIAFSTWRCE